MDVLVDVNVVFALVNERHGFHARACSWLDGQEPGFRICVCRVVQMGLIRLLSNAAAMDKDPLTLPSAWKVYAELATDPAVAFLPEPKGLLPVWIRLCEPYGASPKVLTDAYLAAIALQAGLPLASFDEGFARFPGLDWMPVKKH
jgi:toxin-antitoxin system PIN domain toxin